jgi:hypothetical protein
MTAEATTAPGAGGKHAFAPRAFPHSPERRPGHHGTARERAFCRPQRAKVASEFSLADENPLDGTDPSGLTSKLPQKPTKTQLKDAKTLGQDMKSVLAADAALDEAGSAYLAISEECHDATGRTAAGCSDDQMRTEIASDRAAYGAASRDAFQANEAAGMAYATLANSIHPRTGLSWEDDVAIGTGVVLGVAAAMTGVGAFVAPLLIDEVATVAIGGATVATGQAVGVGLGFMSAVTGAVAAITDAKYCFGASHSSAACVGTALGATAVVAGSAGTAGLLAPDGSALALGGTVAGATGATAGFSGAIVDTIVAAMGSDTGSTEGSNG